MRLRSVAASFVLALAGTWALVGSASALEPGVFVDPGSPAGKEYSIPLSVLRGAAVGQPARDGIAQPLFGAGVGPARAGSGEAAGHAGRGQARGTPTGRVTGADRRPTGRRTAADRRREASRAAAAGARGAGAGSSVRTRTLAGSLTEHGSPAPHVALLGGLVLLVGASLGALLAAGRRRRR